MPDPHTIYKYSVFKQSAVICLVWNFYLHVEFGGIKINTSNPIIIFLSMSFLNIHVFVIMYLFGIACVINHVDHIKLIMFRAVKGPASDEIILRT